jgi:hypothetical protein
MSDPTVITAAVPTITVDPSTAKPPAPAPASPQTGKAGEKPEWLDGRLAEATASGQAKALKALGFESAEDAKTALAELAAIREAKKTDAQKAADLETSLKATKAEKDAAMAALGEYAKGQLAALTEVQRNAVAAVAGDDPAKQLSTIKALTPTWASAAAPAATAAAPAATVKDTAPAASAPKDGNVVSPADPKAIHAELKKTNPVLAARYGVENGVFDKP